jgi:hypothetical protein
MSEQNALERFAGKRIGDVTASVEQLVGRPLPGFPDELQRRTLMAFETRLREVRGVGAFLREHLDLPRCIASSSAPKRLRVALVRDCSQQRSWLASVLLHVLVADHVSGSLHSRIKIARKTDAVAEGRGAGIALELRIAPARQGASYAIELQSGFG